jgi:hypothetical protein
MQLFVLTVKLVAGSDYMEVGGVYDSLERAKEAAAFQLQADGLGITPKWTELVSGDDGIDGELYNVYPTGYYISDGHFAGWARISIAGLNDLY